MHARYFVWAVICLLAACGSVEEDTSTEVLPQDESGGDLSIEDTPIEVEGQITYALTSTTEALLIVPPAVWVVPNPNATEGTVGFKLAARIVGPDMELIPPQDRQVLWGVVGGDIGWVEIDDDGHEVLVEIGAGAPRHEVEISASTLADDGTDVVATAKVMIGPLTTDLTEDWVVVDDTLGAPPAVALVNGVLKNELSGGSLECLRNVPVALVRGAMVGNLIDRCGGDPEAELSVFSVAKQMVLIPAVAWSEVELDAEQVAAPTLRALPIKVWVRVEPPETITDIAGIAAFEQQWVNKAISDVALANNLLRVNRVGLKLVVVGGDPEPISSPNDSDDEIDTQIRCEVSFHSQYQLPGVLNVYYVDDMQWGRAEYCARSDGVASRNWDVIHIHTDEYVSTSFVHEVGHALALITPGFAGHSNDLPGFRGDNVMWGHPDHDQRAEMRSTFSLGQAYRMNVDEFSWLNHSVAIDPSDSTAVLDDGTMARAADETRVPCQCSDRTDEPCPELALGLWPDDPFAQPPQGPEGIGKCSDRVRLYYTEGVQGTVTALLYGRRFRSESGACQWVPAEPLRETSGRIELWFPNLMRDAGCKWRIAVFFSEHAFVFDTLAPVGEGVGDFYENTRPLSYQNGDLVGFWNEQPTGPKDLLEVAVSLWWQGGLADYQDDINADTAMAREIVGGDEASDFSNRTGLEIVWTGGLSPAAGDLDLKAWLDEVVVHITGGQRDLCVPSGSDLNFVHASDINVYYVGRESMLSDEYYDFLDADAGDWCSDGNGTHFVLVNPDGVHHSSTALAHQLGHALSLQDINDGDAGLDETNIMWANPYYPFSARRHLSSAQVYRMNLDPESWLVKTDLLKGLPKVCDGPPIPGEPPCPPIGDGAN